MSDFSLNQQLEEACNDGEYDQAQHLIESGADVNWDGSIALIYAAQNGHVNVVRLLLDNGADVNYRDRYDYTVLHHVLDTALNHSDIDHDCDNDEVVKLLIERGAYLYPKDCNTYTPLDSAYTPYNPVLQNVQKTSTYAIIEAAINSTKVVYTTSTDLQDDIVCFEYFNTNTILLTDSDIPDEFEFRGKPTFTLKHIQQCLDEAATVLTDNDDHACIATNHHDAPLDTLDSIIAQRHPAIYQQMKYWRMNLIHLITYFPPTIVNDDDDDVPSSHQLLSSLFSTHPQTATSYAASLDIHSMPPLHHACFNSIKQQYRMSQDYAAFHDLLLQHSPDSVVYQTIKARMGWHHLCPIIKAKINTLTVEDEETGLVPFMLAAAKCGKDNHPDHVDNDDDVDVDGKLGSLTMVYELLCLKPDVIIYYDI